MLFLYFLLSKALFHWIHNNNNLKIFTSQQIAVDEVKSFFKEKISNAILYSATNNFTINRK